ncbi:GFA family protein [Onishia niordana]|uniref:GFA family protein n=1 Tax=Onishia niordana TaxID=2508711 RepID=UPI00109F2BA2|nr:GFA family protein [Halomonas niordiana]
MSNGPFYQGGCGCGAVSLMATGTPLGTVNCDCGDCRKADGSATALMFWPEVAVQFAAGLDELERHHASHGGDQYRCRHCEEWVLTVHEQACIMELPREVLPEVTEPVVDGTALLVRLGHRRGKPAVN